MKPAPLMAWIQARGQVRTCQQHPSPRQTAAGEKTKRGFGIYLAFLPWVLFTLITQHDTLRAAAVAALAAAVAIAVPSLVAGRPKLLELGAVFAFVGFTVVAFTADPATSAWVARYARAIAASVLALISFGSLLVTPFTEQYARESVPRRVVGSCSLQGHQPPPDAHVGMGVRCHDPVSPDRGRDRHPAGQHDLQLGRAGRAGRLGRQADRRGQRHRATSRDAQL